MTLAQRSVQSAGSILGSYPSWTEEELYWDRSLDTVVRAVEGRTTISPQHALLQYPKSTRSGGLLGPAETNFLSLSQNFQVKC